MAVHARIPHSDATYTSSQWKTVAVVLYVVTLCTLSAMLQQRAPNKWRQLARLPALQRSLLMVLFSSLTYIAGATIYALGVGTASSSGACDRVWLFCLFLFGLSKASMTYFLIERVHIVHDAGTKRRHSRLYIANVLLACVAWGACFLLTVTSDKSSIRADGVCVMYGPPRVPSIVLGLEIFLNTYYGLLFAVPLYRGHYVNSDIRWLAIKSLIAMLVVLGSTTANLTALVVLHSTELSFVCFSTCTLDTFVSASSIFFLTSRESATSITIAGNSDPSLQSTAFATQDVPRKETTNWIQSKFQTHPSLRPSGTTRIDLPDNSSTASNSAEKYRQVPAGNV